MQKPGINIWKQTKSHSTWNTIKNWNETPIPTSTATQTPIQHQWTEMHWLSSPLGMRLWKLYLAYFILNRLGFQSIRLSICNGEQHFIWVLCALPFSHSSFHSVCVRLFLFFHSFFLLFFLICYLWCCVLVSLARSIYFNVVKINATIYFVPLSSLFIART